MNSSDALAAHEAEDRLRDAAPMLLSSLTQIRDMADKRFGDYPHREIFLMADKAIKDARGKQP
jgi:hypothetical protein